jgi:hypothetical protein
VGEGELALSVTERLSSLENKSAAALKKHIHFTISLNTMEAGSSPVAPFQVDLRDREMVLDLLFFFFGGLTHARQTLYHWAISLALFDTFYSIADLFPC